MPQTNVIPDWKATYPNDAKVQKPSGIMGPVSQAVSGLTWTNGTVILTVPATYGYVGTAMTITVSGMTPAAYNGTFPGQVASATTISYPLATNPGPETVLGTVSYTTIVPLNVSTTLGANAVPNKPTYAAGTIQMVDFEAGGEVVQKEIEELPHEKVEPGKVTIQVRDTETGELKHEAVVDEGRVKAAVKTAEEMRMEDNGATAEEDEEEDEPPPSPQRGRRK